MSNQNKAMTENEKRVERVAKDCGINVVSATDAQDRNITTLHYVSSDGNTKFVNIDWAVANEKGVKSDEELGKYILELISQI